MYYNYSHFTDNGTEAQRNEANNPRSQESKDLEFEYTKASVSADHQA